MKTRYHILFFVFSLLYIADVHAQGNVTVHADPRLSVLIKKPHNVDPVTEAPVRKKPVVRTPKPVADGSSATTAKPAVTVAGTTTNSVTTTTTTTSTSTATPAVVSTAAVNMPTAPTPRPLADENGHVAGWTPPVRKVRVIYSGKGYRVQIYSGPDRQKAITIKTEFMRMYPGVRTYLSYMTPSFRVKVGDYRNRSDAVGMWKEANSMYSPCMIVPDIVTISTF